MSHELSRRSLLRLSALSLAAAGVPTATAPALLEQQSSPAGPILLNLNENAFGSSAQVRPAIERALPQLARYATGILVQQFTEQVAAYEQVSPEQVILGEMLGGLGLYLGSNGGPGGEFVYSTPGYLALVNAAANVGGIGVPVPMNASFENDLPALRQHIRAKTRAVYLINPHNPTGTLNDTAAFHDFLREASAHAPVIVDEAYLEYSPDFRTRSAVSLVRDGANVLVFRTFDKIHGLAGLPIGYAIGPRALIAALKKQGLGDAEGLGRLNLVAASAALSDATHIPRIRDIVAIERGRWHAELDALKLQHTPSAANFVFLNARRPHDQIATALRQYGIVVARAFPPYDTWVRITVGTPKQNAAARRALRALLRLDSA